MKIKSKIYQIFIQNEGKIYYPIIRGDIKIQWERNFRAGVLEFDVVKDDHINFQEGNTVTFHIDGEIIFKGFVFRKRRNKEQVISTVCYDQIRYLKSKDTYQYEKKTTADLIKQICRDRNLEVGEIQDTDFQIPKRLEQNQEYLHMIKASYEISLSHTAKLFTLFDEKGKICFKSAENMIVNYPVHYDNAVDFEYETSIDNGTYNRVVVYLVDDNNSLIKKVIKQDEGNIAKWGVLEYTVVTNNAEDIEQKAGKILEVLNRVYRKLSIKRVIGDIRVRAGSVIPVEMMKIGDININSYMIVDKVTHSFADGYHFMDLEVMNKDVQPIGNVDRVFQDVQGKRAAMKEGENIGKYDGNTPDRRTKVMLDSAFSMLGFPYSQAKRGSGKYTDCSYFVWKTMKEAGYQVPKTAWSTATMLSSGCFKEIPFSEVRAGDVGIKPKTAKQSGHTVIALSQSEIIHSTPPRVKRQEMGSYRKYKFYRPIK